MLIGLSNFGFLTFRSSSHEPMHLCACVSEEGGDGEGSDSDASSPMSYIVEDVPDLGFEL
jgi:hypothetical protein